MDPPISSGHSISKSMGPRNLLLTLDAFGTIYNPHPPVAKQYATVAHDFGLPLSEIHTERFDAIINDVYKAQTKTRPNFGRVDVLRGKYGGPRQWWEEVIRESFARVLAAESNHAPAQGLSNEKFELPPEIVDVLINQFAGKNGYLLFDDVVPFFAQMREIKRSPTRQFDRILVGIVTNSDDRVPAVLKALNIQVGNMRADQDISSMELPGFETRDGTEFHHSDRKRPLDVDLDLVITSYEAGEGKPSRLIFDVAIRQARLLASTHTRELHSTPAVIEGTDDWVCVHVGDEYEKDYRGALDAGWESYLVARGNKQEDSVKTVSSLLDLIEKLNIK